MMKLSTLLFLSAIGCGTDTIATSSSPHRPDAHCCYDAAAPDASWPRYDAGMPSLIEREEQAIDIVVDAIHNDIYSLQRQDGTWSVLLQNPQTDNYDFQLIPDLRFQISETSPYSYIEFDSVEDPGVGFSSDVPFYRELLPDTENNLRQLAQDYLRQLQGE